jgi:type VI secretion system protein ImpM
VSLSPLADDLEPPIRAGWFGKLPLLGDFATRRLPPEFVDPWDDWLQRSIAASRRQLGERWLDVYLTSPIWRFVLFEEVCGAGAWGGVTMPSVDKVGRYFPLTIVMPVPTGPSVLRWMTGAEAWFDATERLALGTLDEAFTLDHLEQGLAQLAIPREEAPALGAAEIARWWADPSQPLALAAPRAPCGVLADASLEAMASAVTGRTLWWATAQGASTSCVLGYLGLPPENEYAVMMTAMPHD